MRVIESSKRKNIDDSGTCIIETARVVSIFDKNGNAYKKAQNYMCNKKIDYVVDTIVTADNYGKDGGGLYVYMYKESCEGLMK